MGTITATWIAALGLACGLSACGSFVSLDFGDGIPFNGVNTTLTIMDGHTHKVMAWGEDGSGFRIEWKGDRAPALTADDADFQALGDGELTLTEFESGAVVARLEIVADGLSESRRFTVGGEQRPYEPEGAAWLAAAIPRLIDHTGMGAASRVPRLLAEGGIDAVLADITRRKTNVARNAYFEFVVEDPDMSSADIARAILQAGTAMDSNAQLSDVLEEAVEARPGDTLVLDAVLAAAAGISSDAHLADLLEDLSPDLLVDDRVRGAFLVALQSVGSDAHAADVLEELIEESRDPRVLTDLVRAAAAGISSDAHLADVLEGVPPAALADPAVRAALADAVDTLSSTAHRDAVLRRFPPGALDR